MLFIYSSILCHLTHVIHWVKQYTLNTYSHKAISADIQHSPHCERKKMVFAQVLREETEWKANMKHNSNPKDPSKLGSPSRNRVEKVQRAGCEGGSYYFSFPGSLKTSRRRWALDPHRRTEDLRGFRRKVEDQTMGDGKNRSRGRPLRLWTRQPTSGLWFLLRSIPLFRKTLILFYGWNQLRCHLSEQGQMLGGMSGLPGRQNGGGPP